MFRSFPFLLLFLSSCSDLPWVITDSSPLDPNPPVVPGTPHVCIPLSTSEKEYLIDEYMSSLCSKYPYVWNEPCVENEKLMTCEEFFLAWVDTCPKLDTCDYEECSKALQLSTCGEYPEVCTNIAKCQQAMSTPDIPPPDTETTTSGTSDPAPTTSEGSTSSSSTVTPEEEHR